MKEITKFTFTCSTCGTVFTVSQRNNEFQMPETQKCPFCSALLTNHFVNSIDALNKYNLTVKNLKAIIENSNIKIIENDSDIF